MVHLIIIFHCNNIIKVFHRMTSLLPSSNAHHVINIYKIIRKRTVRGVRRIFHRRHATKFLHVPSHKRHNWQIQNRINVQRKRVQSRAAQTRSR